MNEVRVRISIRNHESIVFDSTEYDANIIIKCIKDKHDVISVYKGYINHINYIKVQ